MGGGFGAFVILLGMGLVAVIVACIPVPNRRARIGYLAAFVGFVIWADRQGMPVAMSVVYLGTGAAIAIIRLYFAVTATFRKT